MCTDIWARCDYCLRISRDKNVIYVPVCTNCNNDIDGFYFHRSCFYAIYDEVNRKIDKNFSKQIGEIKCKKCNCTFFKPDFLWT